MYSQHLFEQSDNLITLLQDVGDVGYNGPKTCAELAAKYTCNDRENKVVLDIGSGTGLVGEEVCYLCTIYNFFYS